MELKHPEGYWVQQLTDENTRDLLDILVSKKKNKKFKRVLEQRRNNKEISIKYYSIKTNCYLSYAEDILTINDYKISGGHSYIDFFEFMIELFGEEYANDLIAFAENYIAQDHNDNWSRRFEKLISAVPAMLDSHNHNTHNDI